MDKNKMESESLRTCEKCNRELIDHEVTLRDDKWICKDCLRENFYKNYELLEQQKYISPETGIVVENYPYGYLRTKIRYWIETNGKKGDRFGSQTLNPKTGKWNKPKYSTYSVWMILVKENKTGYISYKTGCENSIGYIEDIKRIDDLMQKVKVNETQKENIRVIKAYTKAYENVSYEINPVYYKNKETGEISKSINIFELDKWEELTNQEEEERQKEIKQNINKMVNYHYQKTFA